MINIDVGDEGVIGVKLKVKIQKWLMLIRMKYQNIRFYFF